MSCPSSLPLSLRQIRRPLASAWVGSAGVEPLPGPPVSGLSQRISRDATACWCRVGVRERDGALAAKSRPQPAERDQTEFEVVDWTSQTYALLLCTELLLIISCLLPAYRFVSSRRNRPYPVGPHLPIGARFDADVH